MPAILGRVKKRNRGIPMKKGSSGNRKKRRPPRPEAPVNRYPTRDNVYNLQRERAETTGAGGETGTRMAAGADGLCADTASCKEEEAQAEKKGQPHDDAFACICNHCAVSGGADWQLAIKGSDIDVETVAYGTIDTPEVYTGLILREEYVVDSTRDGSRIISIRRGTMCRRAQ